MGSLRDRHVVGTTVWSGYTKCPPVSNYAVIVIGGRSLVAAIIVQQVTAC